MSSFMKAAHRGCGLWLRASLQPATLLGLIMIAGCWIAVAYATSAERATTLEAAILRSENLVRLFEESTDQILLGLDRTLLLLRKGYEEEPDHFNLRNWAERTAVIGALTIQISIIGGDGYVKATTTDYSGPPLYIGDREHFRAHADTGIDTLFISKPMIGRATGKWSIQLSRGIRGKDGEFGGIIIASLDPDFIQKFYESVDLGSHGTIILRRLDGVILASCGLLGPSLGRQAALQPLTDALVEPPMGHYWGRGNIDGVKRLIAYRFDAKFPVIETVGRAESDIFATYLYDRNTYIAVAVLITIMVLFAIAGAAHYQIRLDRARDNLRRSEAQAVERARALELKSRELEVTLDYMSQGIIMTDADDNVRVTNRQAVTLLSPPESFRFDRPTTKGLVPDPAKPGGDSLALRLLDPGIDEPRKPGAGSMDVQVYQRTLPDGVVLEIHSAQLQEGGTVRTISDITERKRAEQEIERIAHHDALTGLANRPLLNNRIDQAFGRMQRYEENFAILCVDLDRFKTINDTFGHQAGDVILRQVTDRLLSCTREVDTVARTGGDEFVVLQANVGRPEDVTPMAERILDAMTTPCDINGNPVVIGASIGIALAPSDGASAEELLGHADLALYRSKSNGRNDFRFFDAEIGESAAKRVKLDLELREALARDQFELWYQPWINIVSGRIAGCEALLRWRHPVRGMVSPADFVPVAEDTGLIVELGEWVLRTACAEAATWPNHIRLAVNVSPVQLKCPTLALKIASALATSGLPASRLELEITEAVLIRDDETALAILHQLRAIGIRIALDDFGTGYSSLSYLKRFPFDKIKIDRCFVTDIAEIDGSSVIVQAVVNIAAAGNMTTTAEGVETLEQKEMLRKLGCTEMQGYLFSAAKPGPEVRKLFGPRRESAAAVA
jgi:diguanylate cyclase (GGDEF)-like protein